MPLAAWLLLLALPAQAPAAAPTDNVEQIVLGSRYDLSVEVGERLDRLRDESQQALRARDAYLALREAAFSSLAAASRPALAGLARMAEIEAQLKARTPGHPVCTYAIDGSGGPYLSPAGRTAIDLLTRRDPAASRADLLKRCRDASPDDAMVRAPCEWVVTGTEHPICRADPNIARVCTWPDEARPSYSPFPLGADLAMLVTVARVLRHPDWSCDDVRPEWLQQGCRALAARDVAACPRWRLDSDKDLRRMLLAPGAALQGLDFALAAVLSDGGRTATLFHDGRFHLTCALTAQTSSGAAIPLEPLQLYPSGQHVASVVLPLPEGSRASLVTARCDYREVSRVSRDDARYLPSTAAPQDP